jgi:hypothetical protein
MSNGFKIKGFPEQPITTVEAESNPEETSSTKKRGPYKKRDKEAEKLATMAPLDRLELALEGITDAPNRIQLEEWKAIHGTYYMSSIDGSEVYIWRTIKRTEYKSLLTSGAMEKPGLLEEFLVRKCLLWPKANPEFMSGSPAGIISTLFKQIYYQSGFISDEESLSMIQKI